MVIEPKWRESISLTVSPKKGDLTGDSDKVIQAAVDYVARLGGGTVSVLPGTYRLRNSIFMRSGVRILGSGTESVLIKEPMVETKLAADSGGNDGIGIDVQGATESNKIARNHIVETRGPNKRVGVKLGAETCGVELIDNRIEGFATAILDLRKKDNAPGGAKG
jgi:hypothetical protein